MRSQLTVLLAALLALAGCSTVSPEDGRSLDQLGRDLANAICPGPPRTVQSVENPHLRGQLDRLETRECAAGSSTLYITPSASKPKTLAVSVEVRGRLPVLPVYLQVGESFDGAMRALGEPQSRSSESAVYGLAFDSTDTLTVRAAGGRIASLEWEWAVD